MKPVYQITEYGSFITGKKVDGYITLDNSLSFNYESCLAFFEQNDFVYPSSWTSGGNVREYTICTSLQDLFFNHSDPFTEELQKIKKEYHFDLPF